LVIHVKYLSQERENRKARACLSKVKVKTGIEGVTGLLGRLAEPLRLGCATFRH